MQMTLHPRKTQVRIALRDGALQLARTGEDIIGASALPAFVKGANTEDVGIQAHESRKGDVLRIWVRSFSGFQRKRKERERHMSNGTGSMHDTFTAISRHHVAQSVCRGDGKRSVTSAVFLIPT